MEKARGADGSAAVAAASATGNARTLPANSLRAEPNSAEMMDLFPHCAAVSLVPTMMPLAADVDHRGARRVNR